MDRPGRRTRQSSVAPQRIGIRMADWPAADKVAWNAACKIAPLLRGSGAGAHWRPASREAVITNYGRWLGFLTLNGWINATEGPADRFDRERVRAFVTYLQKDRAPVTVAGYLARLVMAANAMWPAVDWDWMRTARANLQYDAIPLRSKADRVEDAWRLVDLGFDLMTEAEQLTEADPDKAANLYREGLIIALLAMRPFRRRNFLSIVIGRHLLRSGDSWRFRFPAEETKGKREIEKSFPTCLVVALKRYLAHHRPRLLSAKLGSAAANRAEAPMRLWISRDGNPLSLSGFAKRIGHHTQKRFGWAIDPQSFRHCHATTLGKIDPKAALMGMTMLDHVDFAITDR